MKELLGALVVIGLFILFSICKGLILAYFNKRNAKAFFENPLDVSSYLNTREQIRSLYSKMNYWSKKAVKHYIAEKLSAEIYIAIYRQDLKRLNLLLLLSDDIGTREGVKSESEGIRGLLRISLDKSKTFRETSRILVYINNIQNSCLIFQIADPFDSNFLRDLKIDCENKMLAQFKESIVLKIHKDPGVNPMEALRNFSTLINQNLELRLEQFSRKILFEFFKENENSFKRFSNKPNGEWISRNLEYSTNRLTLLIG